MNEIVVRLTRTISERPADADNPGFIVLAGTRGVVRRVRGDYRRLLDDYEAGREGAFLYGVAGVDGYAEVDFGSYLYWTASAIPGDEWRRAEWGGPWTVLNVSLEWLARGDI